MNTQQDLTKLETHLEKGSYQPAEATPTDIQSYREDMNLQLLKETLAFCADTVPYYKERWTKLGLSPDAMRKTDDLALWPLLHKPDVVENRLNMVSRAVHIKSYRCTTGTTSRRLALPVSEEEVDAINRIGSIRTLASKKEGSTPIVLQIVPPVRRLSSNTGGNGRGPVLHTFLNLDSADHRFEFDYVDHVIQTLTESFPNNDGPDKVEVLWTCPTFMVRTITDSLLRRNFDFAASSVRHLVCSGGIVTQALCDYVKAHWNAPLTGFYSMAEIVGSHRRCPITGRYDFDFMAFPEFLHPETRQPAADEEEGVLVLTSLYPFQQAQPMIRYWTGDVFTVHRGGNGNNRGTVSGTFRGRLHECIMADEHVPGGVRPRIIGSADVLEVLHAIPELPQFHKNPKFKLRLAPKAAAPILIEVETHPQSGQRTSRLRERIRSQFAARLRSGNGGPFDERFIDVRFVDKGELSRASAGYYPDR